MALLIPPVTVEIKGETFKIRPLKARAASKLLLRLTQLVSKGHDGGDIASLKQDFLKILEGALLSEGAEAVFDQCIELFSVATDVVIMGEDGVTREPNLKTVFDDFFCQKQALMLLWLKECLAITYSDFLVIFRDALQSAQVKDPASQPPK
jgi:hypothetical protein